MYLKFILNKALLSNNELFTENNLQLILIKKLIKQRALKNEVSSIILKINMLYNKIYNINNDKKIFFNGKMLFIIIYDVSLHIFNTSYLAKKQIFFTHY